MCVPKEHPSGAWRLAFPRPLSPFFPSPLRLSFQLSSLLPSPFPLSFPLSALLLALFLSLPSRAELDDKYIREGQSIVDVAVTLTGPEERLLVLTGDTNPPCCTYTASGSYNVIGEFEEEAPEISVFETYNWDVDEEVVEIVAGGGATDKSITIRFRPDKESDTSVSVTYSVAPPGDADSDTVEVVVPNWTPGDPIQCGEISTPANDAVLPAGAEVVLAIPQPTDNDTRSGLATTTEADTCIVTWAATAGTFKDGVNVGTSVVWIAPEEGGAGISISATVTDEAVVPPREKGSRSDAGGAAMACSAAAAAPALASFAMTAAGEGGIVRTIQANVARVVSVTCDGTVSTAAAPAVLAVPLGYSDGGGLAGTLTLSPLSNLEGLLPPGVPPWPAGQPEWTGIIANEDGTATLDTTVPGTHQLAVACGTSAVPITVHIVEVAQLECKGVVSVTEAAPDPIVAPDVPVGNPASVTITATLNPAGAPLPVQYLVWTGNHVAGNGLTAILETGTTGTHVAKLTCGTSIKRFSVNVVGISSLHCCGETATPDEPGSLVLPLEHGAPSVQITAIHTPAGRRLPRGRPRLDRRRDRRGRFRAAQHHGLGHLHRHGHLRHQQRHLPHPHRPGRLPDLRRPRLHHLHPRPRRDHQHPRRPHPGSGGREPPPAQVHRQQRPRRLAPRRLPRLGRRHQLQRRHRHPLHPDPRLLPRPRQLRQPQGHPRQRHGRQPAVLRGRRLDDGHARRGRDRLRARGL